MPTTRAVLVPLILAAAACEGGSAHVADGRPADGMLDGPPGCGDGVKAADEACDGPDLGGATCASAVASGWTGVLACTSACQLDVTGCTTPQTTWNSFTDTRNWTTFDISSLFAGAKSFVSTVFDGRYLYFVPGYNVAANAIVARYDTAGSLGASGAWQTFDVSTVSAAATGFASGAFDGRYLYLVPSNNGADDGVFVRYDTQAAFGASASWVTFDLTTVDPAAKGFSHAAFDGRYIYFTPYNGADLGHTARYDTQGAGFTNAGAWTTLDLTTLNAAATGFTTTQFDGRYVYYGQYTHGGSYTGLAARYDTQSAAGFSGATSWTFFDVGTVSSHAKGFYGSQFDGRYLYLIQNYDPASGGNEGWVARYDTTLPFNSTTSWSTFDVTTINANARGFEGGEFDGRYIYLVPRTNLGTADGVAARYDTQASFTMATSWSVFDTTTVNAAAKGFQGGGFDGRYLYLAPHNNGAPDGVLARFDVKTPPWLPFGWNRAFE
jgi:hypothetical protein